MTNTLAAILVFGIGLYLIGLGAVAWIWPKRAADYLGTLASTARAHYLELVVRALAGGALVIHGPGMRWPGIFVLVGWVLLATTAVLFLAPWRWHRRFAEWGVPHAVARLRLVGISSMVLGGIVLYATT